MEHKSIVQRVTEKLKALVKMFDDDLGNVWSAYVRYFLNLPKSKIDQTIEIFGAPDRIQTYDVCFRMAVLHDTR